MIFIFWHHDLGVHITTFSTTNQIMVSCRSLQIEDGFCLDKIVSLWDWSGIRSNVKIYGFSYYYFQNNISLARVYNTIRYASTHAPGVFIFHNMSYLLIFQTSHLAELCKTIWFCYWGSNQKRDKIQDHGTIGYNILILFSELLIKIHTSTLIQLWSN